MRRPLRDRFEETLEKIPRGPLGFAGSGNVVGGVNYFIVALINGLIPIDGISVGFRVRSHNIQRFKNKQVHTFIIDAYNEDVTEFLAKFQSAPSNVDFILGDTKIQSAELLEERITSSTWKIIVEYRSREAIERVENNL